LEDQICCDSLSKEFVELSADESELSWTLLSNRLLGNLLDETFVVRSRDLRLIGHVDILQFDSLQHHDRPSHVAPRIVRNRHTEHWWQFETLPPCDQF